MSRWEVYKEAGLLPSTASTAWVEYPWGKMDALGSLQDLWPDFVVGTGYDQSGKWLLYYPLEEIDAKWQKACEHFEHSDFPHVHHIRAASHIPNLLGPENKRCIVLYVDSDSPEIIMQAGLSIVKSMQYMDCCYYKANDQTRFCKHGKKYMYFIRPECHNASPAWILQRFFPTAEPSRSISENIFPGKIKPRLSQ